MTQLWKCQKPLGNTSRIFVHAKHTYVGKFDEGKFGEHKRGVRLARGETEKKSSSLSALQISQVHS